MNSYTNANILKINTSSAGAIDLAELDNTVKTEGSASLHVHKTDDSTFVFYPTETFLNNSQTHGGISFDIMTSVTVTKYNFLCFLNRTSSYDPNGIVQLPANKWTHVTIPFNGMRDTGNQYDGLFGIINKSAMDIYVDNLRFADEDDNDILNSFEGAQVFKDTYNGDTYWQAGKQELLANTDINALNTRDSGKSQFWINGVQNVSNATIDSTHASAGAQAFRMDVETQGPVYAFYNKDVCNSLLPGDKLEFDVYTDASGATFGKAPTAKRSTATALTQNAWTTVSLEKTSTDQQFFRLNEETLPIGSYWFDNFRVVKNVPSEGITFENGSTSINTTEATYRDPSGKTVRISNTDTNRISAIELISDIGGNSTQMLHITKAASGYTAFYLPSDFKLQMGTNTMSFDLRTTVVIRSDSEVNNLQDGAGHKIKGEEDWVHAANVWNTYTLTPEQITDDGRFMITQGSSQGEYYIDNIRINNGAEQTVEAGNITATIGQNLTVDTNHALSLANTFVLDGVELSLEQYSISGSSLTLDASLVTAGAHTLVVKQAKTGYSCDKYTINFTIVIA